MVGAAAQCTAMRMGVDDKFRTPRVHARRQLASPHDRTAVLKQPPGMKNDDVRWATRPTDAGRSGDGFCGVPP